MRKTKEAARNSNIAVFMDRDGTINEEVGYLNHIDKFKLIPNTSEAIHLLNKKGLKAIVITNQSGVARGYFTEKFIDEVHNKLICMLREDNVSLDGIYYCPHHPYVGNAKYRKRCRCRKPGVGMLEMAACDMETDLSLSYVVGDKVIDIQMACKVGAKGILVLTGYGKEALDVFKTRQDVKPDYIAVDLYKAVEWILKDMEEIPS